MISALTILACLFAAIPAVLFLRNLSIYRPLPPSDGAPRKCSVLIPARNEETNIGEALRSVLTSTGIEFEVIVLDDGSSDRTAEIVREFAQQDSRVRLESAPPLPGGWCGKNHACQVLASRARHSLLVYMDADVRIRRPDALSRLARFLEAGQTALVSGVPREETRGFLERLVIPLIHFILLGFLPMQRMRRSTDPRFAAACGQILAVRRDAYEASGGHEAIRDRIHDAVALTRWIRGKGYPTDLFDATDTFHCRMYRRGVEVWQGFAKNAHEGLGSRQLIIPSTMLLLGGQVLPFALVVGAPSLLTGLCLAVVYLPRFIGAWRFGQSWLGVLLHPLGICVLVAIQWQAFFRAVRRRSTAWKGREYAVAHAS